MRTRREKLVIAVAVVVCAAGCSKKAVVLSDGTSVAGLVGAANAIASSAAEADTFMKARQARGDTVAIPYKDLEGFLPALPSGYAADGGPGGQTMNMGAFSMSTAEQRYVAGADSNIMRIHVTIADYSGNAAGYGMMAPFMAMNISSEDDHHRTATVPMGLPTTFGYGEFNKDTKEAKITVGTRYRFFITVEATDQKSDQSKLVADIATEIAKKFTNK